jgi:DNA-damage-inducible protein J
MATTAITIRIDDDLKKQAETLFDTLGMNMTTALTVFVKAAVRSQKIPFEITAELSYSDYARQLQEIIKQKNIPSIDVEVNEKGHILVDKDKDPDLYDWAVNG